jgi:hypothetical protein
MEQGIFKSDYASPGAYGAHMICRGWNYINNESAKRTRQTKAVSRVRKSDKLKKFWNYTTQITFFKNIFEKWFSFFPGLRAPPSPRYCPVAIFSVLH